MAQHDYIIANQSGAAFRADLNNGLAAIVSQNSGSTQPSTTYAYQWWADTTTGLLKIRNAANNAWITVGTLADTNFGLLPAAGGTMTGNLTLNAQSDLRLADSDSSNWVALQAPATVTSNVTWTLPATDGTADQVLQTNGTGTLGWIERSTLPGTVQFFAGSSAPTGWLKANGAAISRTTYASLFATIGTTFGAGDGSTTFTLPDLRGEFLRAWDDSRGIDSARTFGSFQGGAFANHNHGVTDPGHVHALNYFTPLYGGDNDRGTLSSEFSVDNSIAPGTQGAATGISINNAGGTETRPRNIALLAIIKF